MNADRNDPIDHVIDEALASMVEGEPRQVSGPSVRQAARESRRSSLPMWLAVAAVLIVALTVALKGRAPVAAPVSVAKVVPSPAPIEARSVLSTEPIQAPRTTSPPVAASRRSVVATTTEPVYEGLPRLSIAAIDAPQPLRAVQLDADPIEIPRIEIAPLAVSSLSPEQEHNQEPPQ